MPTHAYFLHISENDFSVTSTGRWWGLNVRPVRELTIPTPMTGTAIQKGNYVEISGSFKAPDPNAPVSKIWLYINPRDPGQYSPIRRELNTESWVWEGKTSYDFTYTYTLPSDIDVTTLYYQVAIESRNRTVEGQTKSIPITH